LRGQRLGEEAGDVAEQIRMRLVLILVDVVRAGPPRTQHKLAMEKRRPAEMRPRPRAKIDEGSIGNPIPIHGRQRAATGVTENPTLRNSRRVSGASTSSSGSGFPVLSQRSTTSLMAPIHTY